MTEALALQGVARRYGVGAQAVEVLRDATCSIARGEIVALVAPSGAGKSTLLQIAGLLDRADAGAVRIAGREAAGLDDGARTGLRRESIGFVYQFHHLLPEFSAAENVMMPQRAAGVGRAQAAERAGALLEAVGLGARARHRPAELSGGEQQRVAVARALANRPSLLLADEPTGNLDPETAAKVFAVMLAAVRDAGAGALVATHNPELAARMDRVLRLREGRLEG